MVTQKNFYKLLNKGLVLFRFDKKKPKETKIKLSDRYLNGLWVNISPVWVLSTGRTGTMALTNLLNLSENLAAFHEPKPNLIKFSYDYYMGGISKEEGLRTISYLRDEFVHKAFYHNKIYVETNNRCTYVSDLLFNRFPASKFIYMVRNPYDVINSGVRRNYYQGNNWDFARIKPLKEDPFFHKWDEMNQYEKVAWYWKKVNETALNFYNKLPDNQKLFIKAEDFFKPNVELIEEIFKFVNSDYIPGKRKIKKQLSAKVNAQKSGVAVPPEEWNKNILNSVNLIIADVANKLGYSLINDEN
jgi:hypothetical protein